MKNLILFLLALTFCGSIFGMQPRGIASKTVRADFILKVKIKNFQDSTVTFNILEELKGSFSSDTIQLNRPDAFGYYAVSHRKGIAYENEQTVLLFIEQRNYGLVITGEFLIENEEVLVMPFVFVHGSFFSEYVKSEQEKEQKGMRYNYPELKAAMSFFMRRYDDIWDMLDKDINLLSIRNLGNSYSSIEGPKIKLTTKKLLKISLKSLAHKRLLDEMIDKIIIR